MKKLLTILGIILLAISLILAGLYFYITNNAEKLVKDFVSNQSGGKFSVDIKKINIDLRELHLVIVEPHFSSNDSANLSTTYDVKLDKIILDLTAIKPLLFERKIYVDSLVCIRPQITAYKWKEIPREHFSLTEQMSKVYNTLDTVIKKLNIKYCLIDSGSLTLVNKIDQSIHPISITDYYIRIDNFKSESEKDPIDRYLFADRIKFYSSHQDIVFPDGIHGIKYSRLRINSLRQSIEIDSCYLYGKQKDGGFGEFGIFFDTLRLSHVDFNKLITSNLLRADSAICLNPLISIRTELKHKTEHRPKEKKYQSRDSLEMAFKALFGNIDVKYIGVLNAKVDIQTKSDNNKTVSYTSQKTDFVIQDLVVIDDPKIPLNIGSLYFGLNAYTTYNSDSSYLLKFDSIIVRNRKISLTNFSITPTDKNNDVLTRKHLNMKSLQIEEFIWLELILNKKIVARNVILGGPNISVNMVSEKPSESQGNSGGIYQILNRLLDKISFRDLYVHDATVDVYSGKTKYYSLNKLNAVIKARELMQARNLNELSNAITNINFASGELMLGENKITLGEGIINGKSRTMHVSRATFRNIKNSSYGMLEGFKMTDFHEKSIHNIGIGYLGWTKGEFIINPTQSAKKSSSAKDSDGGFETLNVEKLEGLQTSIKVNSSTLSASVLLDFIRLEKGRWEEGEKPVIQKFAMQGKSIKLKSDKINLAVQQFQVSDKQPSYLNQFYVHSISKQDTISVKSQQLTFAPDINSFVAEHPVLNDIIIKSPEIRINPTGDTLMKEKIAKKASKIPSFSINQLSIVNPVFINLPGSISKKINAAEQISEWHFIGISTDSNRIDIDGVKSSVQGFTADTKNLHLDVSGEGKLNFTLANIHYLPATAVTLASWSGTMTAFSAKEIAINTSRNDTINNTIQLHYFQAENMSMQSNDKRTFRELLSLNKRLLVSKSNISISSAKNNMKVEGLQYDQANNRLSFDSFSVKPTLGRDSFMKTKVWQTDYLEFNVGKTDIWGLDKEKFFKDSIFYASKIEARNPMLQVYKDKHLPFDFSKIKPLPVSMIRNLNSKIKIDSIRLYNANITYEEFNEKTEMIGAVHFKRTQALIENIKTYDIGSTDSLRLSAYTWLMDSAFIRMRFTESYTDSLNGFLFAVRMRPFNLSALNPMLEPIVSAKILSGRIDTIHMNAIGREYLAHGKMKMYYHDLKAQYLKNGEANVKTLKTRIINFAANDLILHNSKTEGYGEVYTERIRERSFVNYWLKMAISGLMSNTGVKSNKKQAKKYQKSLRKLQVPEIPEVTL